MNLEFLSPEALWFLLVVPVIWVMRKFGSSNLSRGHWFWVAFIRSSAIVCLVLGISQPVLKLGDKDPSVVFLMDISASIPTSFILNGMKWIDKVTAENNSKHSQLIVFADRALPGDGLLSKKTVARNFTAEGGRRLNPNVTNIEDAVKYALMSMDKKRAKRLVLLTDGNETAGSVWRQINSLKNEKVRVYPMIPSQRSNIDTWVSDIVLPNEVRQGELFVFTVKIYSPLITSGEVQMQVDQRVVESRRVQLKEGINDIDFEMKLNERDLVTIKAELLIPDDPVIENNVMESTLWVNSKPQILLITSNLNSEESFIKTLSNSGFVVERLLGTKLPSEIEFYNDYDLVLISNVDKNDLSEQGMNLLLSYVRDYGGGLVFAAGENVFGENGYSGTPIERLLPAEFKARERKKDLALVIAIDRSYSMKGRKIEYAKEAARAALDLLEEQHKFSVVAFDSQPYISVPMRMVRSKRRAEDRISRIKASGQTNIYPALGVVYRLLKREKSVAKHVILLSDGDTHPADFEKLLSRVRQAGIIVSTVTIGKTGDPELMSQIARWGGGQNYVALSAEAIPQIFIEETQKALNSGKDNENINTTVEMNVKALSGIEFDMAPELNGLVPTKSKDTADVLLNTGGGDPLLSRWQYGLGKTVLFSSTLSGEWARDWVQWSEYGKFWEQVIRSTMRKVDIGSTQLRVVRAGKNTVANIVLLDEDGQFRDGLTPVLDIKPDTEGIIEKHQFRQVGPGTYQADILREVKGKTTFALSASGGVGEDAANKAGKVVLHSIFPDELRSIPPNIELLDELAKLTGGEVSPMPSTVFDGNVDGGFVVLTLMPWLAGLCLLLFLLDVWMRRAPAAWKILGDIDNS